MSIENVNKKVQTLANKLGDSIAFENGASNVPSNVYFDNAPKGLTVDTINKVSTYNEHFVEATALALNDAIVKSDDAVAFIGNDKSAVASWNMGDNQQVSHILNANDKDEWSAYTEVHTELSENSVLESIHNVMVEELNK